MDTSFKEIKKTPNINKNLKNKNSTKKLKLLLIIIVHYFDIITDLLFTYYFITEFTLNTYYQKSASFYVITITLLYSQLKERQLTYQVFQRLVIDLQKSQIQQLQQQQECSPSQQQQEIKDKLYLTAKEKIQLLICTVTYIDLIYMIKFSKLTSETLEKELKIKKVFDLFSENLIFLVISSWTIYNNYNEQLPLSYISLISLFTSYLDCVFTLYQIYIERIEQYPKYSDLQNSKFKDFPLNLQLYISNPFEYHMIKFLKASMQSYQAFLQNPDIHMKNIQYKCKIWVKMFVLFFLMINVLSKIFITIMGCTSKYKIPPQYMFLIGFLYLLPQFFHYQILTMKQNKKQLCFNFLKMPLLFINGAIQLFVPIITYEIPFFSQSQSLWIHNYYSNRTTLFCQTVIEAFILIMSSRVVFFKLDPNPLFLSTQEKIDRITNPECIIRLIFWLALVICAISFIFKFLAFIQIRRCNINIYQEQQKLQNINSNENSQMTDGVALEIKSFRQLKSLKTLNTPRSTNNLDSNIHDFTPALGFPSTIQLNDTHVKSKYSCQLIQSQR